MLFDFGMETRRINEIIEMGAKRKLTDKAFLEHEIQKFIASKERKAMLEGKAYYAYDQDIKDKKRMVIGENGKMLEDVQLPNCKLTDNQYAAMVDQKVDYVLSKPVTFKTENRKYAKALGTVFNKNFQRLLKNVGKDSYNGGIGWLYPYYDQEGNFCIRRFAPEEILPFWKDDDHTELDCAVRVHYVWAYEGDKEKKIWYVEVYDTEGIHYFEYKDYHLVPNYTTYYFWRKAEENSDADTNDSSEFYSWNKVPLIAFKGNSIELPLICKCKCLQDGINEVLSSFGDGMKENSAGTSILIIKNYGGTNLGEFRQNLMTYKAVKVETVDGDEGGVDSLKIEVNAENYKTILQELKKALIQNCRGYDVEGLKTNGSPNEMTIKAVFSGIDLDANEIETEYQASFEQLLWFVNVHFKNTGVGDFMNEEIDVIFNRDLMINESQIITDCQNSTGVISHKTIVANHPWVTDPEEEWKQIEEEKNEALDPGYDFGNTPKEPDEEDEDEEE